MFNRLGFLLQVIDPKWQDLKLTDSFMLKFESMYKNSFPKNQDSRLRSLMSCFPPKVKNTSIDIVPLDYVGTLKQASDIAGHITHV